MTKLKKETEKEFFDSTFESGGREPLSKFYAVVKSSRKYYEEFLHSNCRNKNILEYGCGSGSYAFDLARRGANVIGIDISEVAIRRAKTLAKEKGIENIVFFVMDAEIMQFEDSSFDMVCGTGILHHLHLDKSLKELTRILRNDGKAIFIEPMGHNPALNLFRKFTP